MATNFNLSSEFDEVKDAGERIYWTGRPNFRAFILQGIPFLIFGLIWGVIDFSIIKSSFRAERGGAPELFLIPFFFLHLFPFWGSILNMVRLIRLHGKTSYAVSNKRLMIRGGYWGGGFKAIDYDKIVNIEVTVNPIENALKVGSIRIFSGAHTMKGRKVFDRFIGIEDPNKTFKKIKEVSAGINAKLGSFNEQRSGEQEASAPEEAHSPNKL